MSLGKTAQHWLGNFKQLFLKKLAKIKLAEEEKSNSNFE